ncbi:hypothetical protein [Alteromonas sp. CYL-A6]|uniref:hypothetical protein n=1 Tax=Alteromonas nitratireducens TaxID=3390813 RepID=UPI0034B99B4E
MASPKFHNTLRKYHRWLGFFLAGIMSVYAISGILLIFRPTDFMKFENVTVHQLSPALSAANVADTLKVKGLKVVSETPEKVILNMGEYDKASGAATVTTKEYPAVLNKMVKLHKATNNSPLYWLNIAFGLTLLFFVVSAFLMFMPHIPLYKSSLKIAAAGAVFAVLVVLFGS